MRRTSIYDRISENRLKAEALAREEADRIADEPMVEVAEVALPASLQHMGSSFNFGGFEFSFPKDLTVCDIAVTAQVKGEPVSISMERRPAAEGSSLAKAFAETREALAARYPGVRIIRQRESALAGNPAMVLDFIFRVGHGERHGRLAGAIVPLAGGKEHQWLCIACVIDPQKPALSDWLLNFDNMLTGLAPR